jgi:hypothetical protein
LNPGTELLAGPVLPGQRGVGVVGTRDVQSPLGIDESRLLARIPELSKCLTLPPGSRFLLAPDHADVWDDLSLLDV